MRLDGFDPEAAAFCESLFGVGLGTKTVQKSALVYVNEQHWTGFKKPVKEGGCNCSVDHGA